MKTKYVDFIEDDMWLLTHKTKRFIVRSRSQEVILGHIKFNSHWRQYCFFPVTEYETIWSAGCLYDIMTFIEAIRYGE